MAQVQKSVLVWHPAKQMFDLVDAVETYPQFLPWCGGATVQERTDAATLATIDINYHGIRHGFTTRNRKEPPEWMHIDLVSGPFEHLTGHWHFIPLSQEACKIEFKLEYEFSSKVLEKLIGQFMFDKAAGAPAPILS